MIAETLIILFVIGVHKKYSFENLNYLPSRAYGFLLAFVGIKLTVFLCAKFGVDFAWLRFISFFSHILLMAFLYYNRNYKGVYLIMGGLILNWLVMYVNGFKMPIDAHYFKEIASTTVFQRTLEGSSLHHTIMNQDTRLGFLADVIPLMRPYPFPKLLSIGDVLLGLGVIIMGISVLRGDYLEEN